MREKFAKTEHMKKRLFQIVEVGYTQDRVSRLYDIVNVAAIIINLVVSILYTFAPVEERYGGAIVVIEGVTVMFFTAVLPSVFLSGGGNRFPHVPGRAYIQTLPDQRLL